MKKYILLLFLIFPTFIFAQQINVMNAGGYQWEELNQEQKLFAVAGFFTGIQTTALMIQNTVDADDPNLRTYQRIYNWLTYPPTPIPLVVSAIDTYYEREENKRFTIWAAILVTYRKQWWSQQSRSDLTTY